MPKGESSPSTEFSHYAESEQLKSLRDIKRMFCIDRGEPNVGAAITKMTAFAVNQAQEFKRGSIAPTALKTPVLIEEGPPLSAKTYTMRELIHPHLKQVLQGAEIKHQHLHWDTIEDDLTAARIIEPVPRQPFKPFELRTVGTFLNLLIAQALRKNNDFPLQAIEQAINQNLLSNTNEPQDIFRKRIINTFGVLVEKYELAYDEKKPLTFLTVDKPGATGIGSTVVKEYSNNTVPDLLHGRNAFANMPSDGFYLGTIGLVGGSSMDQLLEYREGINTAQTLEQANAIRNRFGFKPFLNESIWHSTQGGGSREQTKAAQNESYNLVRSIYKQTDSKDSNDFKKTAILPPYITSIIQYPVRSVLALHYLEIRLGSETFSDLQQDIQRATSFTHYQNIHTLVENTALKAGLAAVLSYNFGMYSESKPDVSVVAQTTAPIRSQIA